MSENHWFTYEIGLGLAKMAALQLPGTPIDTKTAAAMRSVWVDALWPLKQWDENRDKTRIKAAFNQLYTTVERFPAPVHFLRVLPDHAPQPRLPAPKMSQAQRQANLARVQQLIKTVLNPKE